jgi:uncharacterized membrane protein YhaH (DUF805 family)
LSEQSERTHNSNRTWWLALLQEWSAFFAVILSPWVVTCLVLTSFLIFLGMRLGTTVPTLVNAILTIFVALSSSVLGALIWDRWVKKNETGILVTRGKSAIRGLKLLLTNIALVERRVEDYQSRLSQRDVPDPSKELIAATYEELVIRCRQLQEEAVNAIEEWQDIVPEAATLTTQIGVITDLQQQSARLAREIQELHVSLSAADAQKGASREEIVQLEKKLIEKEAELRSVNRKLQEKWVSGYDFLGTTQPGRSYLTGTVNFGQITGSYLPGVGIYSQNKTCRTCGKEFENSLTGILQHDQCPACRNSSLKP